MMSHRPWSTLLIVWATACGGAQASHPQAGTPTTPIDPSARELAPDLAARIDRAEANALSASDRGDQEAATDHRERARLWRVALAAEAERIAIDRERESINREIEAMETTRIADEQTREAIEQAIKREQAATIARAEAARVMTEAESDEGRRRGGDPARIESRREASRALIDRSAAILSAAIALGEDGLTIASGRKAIEAARHTLDGSPASMAAASTAFALAQRALGHARSTRPGPSTEERASLLEGLGAQGWPTELLDDGVVIWLSDLATGSSAALRPGANILLANLGGLLAGHPHGPIQLQVMATATVSTSAAQRRAQLIKAGLVAAGSDRVELISSVNVGDRDSAARVVLPAYGCSALANDAAQCTQVTTPASTPAATIPETITP